MLAYLKSLCFKWKERDLVIFSNMSNREAFKLIGGLPTDRIEDLLNQSDQLTEIKEAVEDEMEDAELLALVRSLR